MPQVTVVATEVVRRTVVHGTRYAVSGVGGYTVAGQDDGSVVVSRTPGAVAVARSTVDVAVPYVCATTLVVLMHSDLVPGGATLRLVGGVGAYVLTGQTAGLLASRLLGAVAGEYAVGGQDAGLRATRLVGAGAGEFVLDGSDAGLLRTLRIAAAEGGYALAGEAARLILSRVMASEAGAYAVGGQGALLVASRKLTGDAGAYALAGQDARLLFNRRAAADAAAFVLGGQDAGLRFTRKVLAVAGAYALAGQDAGLRASRKAAAAAGAYVWTGVAAGVAYLDTDANALIAAMSVTPDNARKAAIATLIAALKTAGVWSKLDLLYLLAAHDEQAGRLNWKSPGSFTLTAINSPTFTTDRGFAGNGSTSYLDTGWDAATDGVGFTQNSAHIGVYARTNSTISTTGFGTTLLLRNQVIAQSTGSGSRVRINSDTLGQNPAANGTLPLHRIGTRRASSTTVVPILDGVAGAGLALTSSATTTSDFAIGRHNNTNYGNAQIAAAHAGDALDDTEAAAVYAALYAYMVAVGADT